MIYIEQAIQKSIKGGYKITPVLARESVEVDVYKVNLTCIFLQPLFWQALGKALGWDKEEFYGGPSEDRYEKYMHRFIDHLIEQKEPEEFFKDLLT